MTPAASSTTSAWRPSPAWGNWHTRGEGRANALNRRKNDAADRVPASPRSPCLRGKKLGYNKTKIQDPVELGKTAMSTEELVSGAGRAEPNALDLSAPVCTALLILGGGRGDPGPSGSWTGCRPDLRTCQWGYIGSVGVDARGSSLSWWWCTSRQGPGSGDRPASAWPAWSPLCPGGGLCECVDGVGARSSPRLAWHTPGHQITREIFIPNSWQWRRPRSTNCHKPKVAVELTFSRLYDAPTDGEARMLGKKLPSPDPGVTRPFLQWVWTAAGTTGTCITALRGCAPLSSATGSR